MSEEIGPIAIDILRTLRKTKLKEQTLGTMKLRREIQRRWGIKKTKFYDSVGVLKQLEYVKTDVDEDDVPYYYITPKGIVHLQGLETRSTPIDIERLSYLRDETINKLSSAIEDVTRIARGWRVFLSVGRSEVWDSLAALYGRTRNRLLLLGVGADFGAPLVEQQIVPVKESIRKLLEEGEVEVRRIQPVNTWVSWASYQTELIFDGQNNQDRENYELCFTNEEPRFITQLNIKDDDEAFLVPPETDPRRTHGFHITDEYVVETYESTFFSLVDRYKDSIVDSRALRPFVFTLDLVRELQTNLLIAFDFCGQRNLWSHSKIDRAQLSSISYEHAQLLFPIDYIKWEEKYVNWVAQNGAERFTEYCKADCRTLYETLSMIFPDRYPKMENDSQMMEATFQNFPPIQRKVLLTDLMIKDLLKSEYVKEASRDFIAYLSNQCLFEMLESIISETK